MDYEKIKEIELIIWDHLQERGVALNVYTVLTSLDEFGYLLPDPPKHITPTGSDSPVGFNSHGPSCDCKDCKYKVSMPNPASRTV